MIDPKQVELDWDDLGGESEVCGPVEIMEKHYGFTKDENKDIEEAYERAMEII